METFEAMATVRFLLFHVFSTFGVCLAEITLRWNIMGHTDGYGMEARTKRLSKM